MDINMLQHPIAKIVIGLVAYLVVSFAAYYAVQYFYGWEAADRFIGNTLLLPFRALCLVLEKIYMVVSHPWRYRKYRMFKEIFYFNWPKGWDEISATQAEVSSKLSYLARNFKRAKDELGQATGTQFAQKKQRVSEAQLRFIKAKQIAKQAGYTVRDSFLDYI